MNLIFYVLSLSFFVKIEKVQCATINSNSTIYLKDPTNGQIIATDVYYLTMSTGGDMIQLGNY